jgi:hypothetical protein
MSELTKAEKLLVAAARIDATHHSEFTAEDLVVEAFKRFPNDFSLKGYPEYPDNNSVLTMLMGKEARLIASGWLSKTGTKKYRITPKGVHDAAERIPDSSERQVQTVRNSRKMEEGLARLFQSEAFESASKDSGSEITFHQFCRFIGLAAPDTWQKVQGKLEEVKHLVEQARELGESGQNIRVYFRGASREYKPEDLILLKTIFGKLTRRFQSEMDAWERKARNSR